MGYASQPVSVAHFGWAEDQGRRGEMEDGWVFVDAFTSDAKKAFFGVYDGHGGRQSVDFVTHQLHRQIQYAMEETHDMSSVFQSAFKNTDDALWTSGIRESGCTACCCVLDEEEVDGEVSKVLFTAHVGDTRAVLCRPGFGAVRLTAPNDHKATCAEEADRVLQSGGAIINERVNGMLAITRAFGDHQLKAQTMGRDIVVNTPHTTGVYFEPGDLVIVACDGLWDVVDDQEAADLLQEGLERWDELLETEEVKLNGVPDKGEILSAMLVEEALARGTSDNVTCMVCVI